MTRPNTRPLRRARLLGAGAALLLGVGALTGCTAHPGRAATVNYTDADGARQTVAVSEQEVQEATQQLVAYSAAAGNEGPDTSYVLNALTSLPMAEQLGAEFGITVTDEEALAALREQGGEGLEYSPAAVDVFRYLMLATQIYALEDQDAVTARLQELRSGLSVETSPRYQGGGAWLLQESPVLQLG